jgi:hypothetical protein
MAKEVTKLQAKQQKNFEAMTPELQKVATAFDSKVKAAAKGAILIAYDMGVKLKEVIAKEASYGTNAVEQLAVHMGATWSATKLYSYRDFAVQYPKREDVQKLVEAKLSGGGHVTVSHCLAIGKVKDIKTRRQLWKKVFDEGLSSEALKAEIQAKHETRNERQGGRKPSRPTSVIGGAQEIAKMTNRLNNKFEVWNDAVIQEVMSKPAEEMTPALLEKLHEAEAAMETAENNLMTYRPKLQKALDRAEKLSEKAEAKAAKEEEKASKKKAAGKKKVVKKAAKKKVAKKAAKKKKKAAK